MPLASFGYPVQMLVAATATGFPALLIILGVLGLVVSLGILIARRRGLAGRCAAGSALLIVAGVLLENVT